MPVNPIADVFDALHEGLLTVTDGTVATYIPELAHADPGWFGLALATRDDRVYSAGDAEREFTLQSVSKPFVYALALADLGLDGLLAHVGVEPSGESFNAISLEPRSGRPANPMVNAGAILTTSLVAAADATERFERIRAGLSAFAGRELEVDERVYASESATGNRNRALAYLMRSAGALGGDVEDAVATYFRQCSVRVTARDLAVMSVTLANAGHNPLSGERVIDEDTAAHVLTVMATCGMYDFAGEWLLRVGLPAKGGVSGGIAAVLPAQFGIGVFSPPLDARGNSVRGIAVCEELSVRLGLHLMRPVQRTAPALYRAGDGTRYRSTAERGDAERDALCERGRAIEVRSLQGDIGFASAETLVHGLAGTAASARWLVLDLDRVGGLYPVARRLLDALARELAEVEVTTVVVDGEQRHLLRFPTEEFASLDEALRWCEDQLLR